MIFCLIDNWPLIKIKRTQAVDERFVKKNLLVYLSRISHDQILFIRLVLLRLFIFPKKFLYLERSRYFFVQYSGRPVECPDVYSYHLFTLLMFFFLLDDPNNNVLRLFLHKKKFGYEYSSTF